MVDLVVTGSLLRVWEVDVLGLNPAMGSPWKITLYCRLMLTSILNGVGCTTMTHLDPSFSRAQAQWVRYHYDHAQVEDAND